MGSREGKDERGKCMEYGEMKETETERRERGKKDKRGKYEEVRVEGRK